jgi:nucleoside triphosphate diphosphatase
MDPSRDIGRLLEIMAALRTPETGCPWDLAQNFSTIAPYTLEEAYEVADAIARDDLADLKDELGDLLLQVVFHARMAEEQGAFDFGDVVQAITEKLIRRHPHVFANQTSRTPRAVEGLWERIKAEEKATNKIGQTGALAGIPIALPALSRALKLQNKASKVGFDWNDPRSVLRKIREEADEIEVELDRADTNKAATAGEVGDLLFAVVNLARQPRCRSGSGATASQSKIRTAGGLRFIPKRVHLGQACLLRGFAAGRKRTLYRRKTRMSVPINARACPQAG